MNAVRAPQHWTSYARRLNRLRRKLGRSLVGAIARQRALNQFKSEYREFSDLSSKDDRKFELNWADIFPQLDDATSGTHFDTHYVYHPAWAARLIAGNVPDYHVDISSILSFATLTSAFVPFFFFDYRPARLKLKSLNAGSVDLTSLPFRSGSLKSVSCMHVVEHVGLGRYGDPIDPQADLRAMRELQRVIAPDGNLFFVVPVGRPRIVFNAHRVYSYEQIAGAFKQLELREFSLIPDDAMDTGIIRNASSELVARQTYGCGCFWFRRTSSNPSRE